MPGTSCAVPHPLLPDAAAAPALAATLPLASNAAPTAATERSSCAAVHQPPASYRRSQPGAISPCPPRQSPPVRSRARPVQTPLRGRLETLARTPPPSSITGRPRQPLLTAARAGGDCFTYKIPATRTHPQEVTWRQQQESLAAYVWTSQPSPRRDADTGHSCPVPSDLRWQQAADLGCLSLSGKALDGCGRWSANGCEVFRRATRRRSSGMICGRAWVGTLGVAIPHRRLCECLVERDLPRAGEGTGFAALPSRGGSREVRGGQPDRSSRARGNGAGRVLPLWLRRRADRGSGGNPAASADGFRQQGLCSSCVHFAQPAGAQHR